MAFVCRTPIAKVRVEALGSVDFSPHLLASRDLYLHVEFEFCRFARGLTRGLKSTLLCPLQPP